MPTKPFILPQGKKFRGYFRRLQRRETQSLDAGTGENTLDQISEVSAVVFIAANFCPGENNFFVTEGQLLLNFVNYLGSGHGIFVGPYFGHNAICAGAMTAILNLYQATSPTWKFLQIITPQTNLLKLSAVEEL